jgi:hypothetical protein
MKKANVKFVLITLGMIGLAKNAMAKFDVQECLSNEYSDRIGKLQMQKQIEKDGCGDLGTSQSDRLNHCIKFLDLVEEISDIQGARDAAFFAGVSDLSGEHEFFRKITVFCDGQKFLADREEKK